jgi:ABC-type dipeptide/oligopeptide/nickel transport system ATPase subunit
LSPPQWVRALKGIDLSIGVGESLALIGESGGGKTTLVRILLGLLAPSEGQALAWIDHRPHPMPLPRLLEPQLRRRVQLASQDPASALDPALSCGAAIAEGYAVQYPTLARHQRYSLVESMASRLGLRADVLERRPRQVSGGEQRRVILARALAALGYGLSDAPSGPLLIADEPTAGLDAIVRDRVVAVLDEEQRRRGLSLLLVTHDIAVARRLTARVAVIAGGCIVEAGDRSLLDAPQAQYTQELVAADHAMNPQH